MKKLFKLAPIALFGFCLVFNSCSEESLENSNNTNAKIIRLSERLDANIKIDEQVTKENSILIETEEELIQFIESTKAQLSKYGIDLVQPTEENAIMKACADGVYVGSGVSSGFATLTFDVSVSNGCITGISGGFTGWTLGISYTQGGTSIGCKSGTVCGTINYNIFFEGIGTVYQERICYRLSLNC